MRKAIFVSVLVLLSVLVTACGGAETPTETTFGELVDIKVESTPNPAMVGDIELVIIIMDAHGDPIEGAQVDVSVDHADMVDMAMGGAATDQGGGKYAINANFSMSGNWKLTVYVHGHGLNHKEDFDFKVQ